MIEQHVSRDLRHSDTANSDIFAEHSFPAGGLVALSLIAYQRSPWALLEIRAGVFVFSGAGGNVFIIKSIIPDAYPQCSKTRNANASYRRSRDEVARDGRRLSLSIGQSELGSRCLSRDRAIDDAGNLQLAHRRRYDRHAEFRGHEVDD